MKPERMTKAALIQRVRELEEHLEAVRGPYDRVISSRAVDIGFARVKKENRYLREIWSWCRAYFNGDQSVVMKLQEALEAFAEYNDSRERTKEPPETT